MKKTPLHLLRKAALAGSALALPAVAHGQLITNGLLVDFDATSYAGGAVTNNGSLGGQFTPDGNPTPIVVNGVRGAFLDGREGFVGPASPDGITGTGDRTVEAWVYNGAANGEETLVAWGKRGGGDGTNNSVNWGSNATWGAFGGWGAGPDQGFGAGQPAVGQWHHIVFTADAASKSVYVDGVLASTETNDGPALNTHAGLDILIGSQQNAAATPGASVIDADNKLSGVIGKVRVHDGALSAADVLNNFNFERNQFIGKTTASAPLTAAPTHRWSFNETTGTSFADTGTAGNAGSAALLKGAGAVLTGSAVDLPGGSSATAAYIDLPNFVASGKDIGGGYTSATYEAWVTMDSTQNWSRVFDLGANTAGEINEPGGSFGGDNTLLLSNNIGTDGNMRLERNGGAQPGFRDSGGATILGTEQHLVVTYDGNEGMWRVYQDGKLMEGFDSDSPASLNDINNWLGRSNWDGDANADGKYNEFRIYDYALTPEQIAQNAADGPNALTVVPEASSALLSVLGLAFLNRRRRRE